MTRILSAWVLLAVALSGSPAVAALSLSDSVRSTYLFPDTSTVYAGPQTITGPTDTILNFASFADVTFSPTSIVITTTRNAGINDVAFDGFKFEDLNQTLNFASAALNVGATTYASFVPSRLTTSGPDTIFVNVANLPGLQGEQIVVNLSPVPEPHEWAMMLAGLGLVAWIARRRARPESGLAFA